MLCVKSVYHDLGIGVYIHGSVAVVDDHAGLAAGDFLHLTHRGYVHRQILTTLGLGIIGCQLGGLGDGIVRGDGAAAGDDHVGAVDLAGVAPNVILSG